MHTMLGDGEAAGSLFSPGTCQSLCLLSNNSPAHEEERGNVTQLMTMDGENIYAIIIVALVHFLKDGTDAQDGKDAGTAGMEAYIPTGAGGDVVAGNGPLSRSLPRGERDEWRTKHPWECVVFQCIGHAVLLITMF